MNKWTNIVQHKMKVIVDMCRKKSVELHQLALEEYHTNGNEKGCLMILLNHIQEIHRWMYADNYIQHAINDYKTESDLFEQDDNDDDDNYQELKSLLEKYDPKTEFVLFFCIANVLPHGESAYCFEIINKEDNYQIKQNTNNDNNNIMNCCFHCQEQKNLLRECTHCRLFVFCSDECKEKDSLHHQMCPILYKVYNDLFISLKDEKELIKELL